MKIDTIAIHAGQSPEPITGAIMTPVFQTSTYVQKSPGEHTGFEYSRTHNPTRDALENNLAALEGGKYGAVFASGCAASTTIIHLFKAGDHIICGDDIYGGTYRLFDKVLTHMGIEFSFVDLTDTANIKAHVKSNTKAVWVETPTNPLLKIADLEQVSSIAHQHNLMVICDNTFATPIFQNPLALGCDIVVHSTTKFINGHSDVVGGAAVTNDKTIYDQLKFLQNSMGAVQGPWDCWLILRGTKTLPLRMRAHDSNGRAVAAYLDNHPKVTKVIYPGLPSHPQHELAKKQMSGFGGMISFIIKGGEQPSRDFLSALKIFALAESLGGVESLAEHPAIMTHASIEPEIRAKLGIDDGMVRLSVGIENIDDLIADLSQAFEQA